jgi:iron(III) transport system ATP-binding protein
MLEGRIAQVAAPEQLYHRPASRAVARFVGEANFLPAEAQGDTAAAVIGVLPLAAAAYGAVDVLLRPEDVSLSADGDTPNAAVIWREFYGHDQRLGLRLDDGSELVARLDSRPAFAPGQRVRVGARAPLHALKTP